MGYLCSIYLFNVVTDVLKTRSKTIWTDDLPLKTIGLYRPSLLGYLRIEGTMAVLRGLDLHIAFSTFYRFSTLTVSFVDLKVFTGTQVSFHLGF